MDLRKAAEERALRSLSTSPVRIPLRDVRSPVNSPIKVKYIPSRNCEKEAPEIETKLLYPSSRHHQYRPFTDENIINGQHLHHAADDALLIAKDYEVNGDRAILSKVRPRWVLDEETDQCKNCEMEFDIINRRHHCRHCGNIYCASCTSTKYLLPPEFEFDEPQRVCIDCAHVLSKAQGNYAANANHTRKNAIDMAPRSVSRYCNMPYTLSMAADIRKATYSIHNLFNKRNVLHDDVIPATLLSNAKGIVFVTILKAGLIYGGRIGTGIIIKKVKNPDGSKIQREFQSDGGAISELTRITTRIHTNRNSCVSGAKSSRRSSIKSHIQNYVESGGWSAPSAIGVVGINYGFFVGCDVSDYVIFLNTDEAMNLFSDNSNHQVSIGGVADMTLGMVGRSGGIEVCTNSSLLAATPAGCCTQAVNHSISQSTGLGLPQPASIPIASTVSYAHSRGMLIGASIEGTLFSARNEINLQFYGRNVSPSDILNGDIILPPVSAQPLYDALKQVSRSYQSTNSIPTAINSATSRHRNQIETNVDEKSEDTLFQSSTESKSKHRKNRKSGNTTLKNIPKLQPNNMRRTSILI